MSAIHSTVTFEQKSGLPEDRVVNTFTFSTGADWTAADLDAIEVALLDFYNGTHAPATESIAKYLAPSLSRTVPPVFRHYDVTDHLAGTPAGSPIRQGNAGGNLAAPIGGSGIPAECAIALSYRGAYGADVEFAPGARPRARDRGRVFLGPLTSGVLSQQATTDTTIVVPSAVNAVVRGGQDLMDDATVTWCVWSRRAAAITPVQAVWCDNAFDTQRRRGAVATIRTTLP